MAKMATREAYGKALAQLAKENQNVLVLDADLSGSTKTAEVKKESKSQHFNMGIAESNMIAIAAGLATSGNIVFASSFAMFAAGRAFEQVRNSIAYAHLNVKVCATHSGLTVGEDGASHQSIEDVALMRSIPGMVVISPADGVETTAAIRAVAEYEGPCYVRLGRMAVEDVYTQENLKFEIGKANVLCKGSKVAIIANGIMVGAALEAYKVLKEKGYEPSVVDMHTIKPLDKDVLHDLANTHDVFVTCEEHSIIGGLGSAVSEALSTSTPRKVVMVGIQDTFGESGDPAALLEKYGLTANDIVKAVQANT